MRAGLTVFAALAAFSAQAQWSVERLPAAEGKAPAVSCHMASAWQDMFDGYQTTQVRVVVDEARFELQSRAPFDNALSDVALQVDGAALLRAESLLSDRVATFALSRAQLVRQCIPGSRLRIHARFWPTWPQTAVQTTDISLIGFTRAFEAYSKCE